MTVIINFFAGPGAGKSTMAASVYAMLKQNRVNAEFVPEFAKELTWRGENDKLDNQLLVTGTQLQRNLDLIGKVDYIITDSPVLLAAAYCKNHIEAAAVEHAARDLNRMPDVFAINYFVEREEDYQNAGRNQSKEEAIEIDEFVRDLLSRQREGYISIRRGEATAERITYDLLNI